MPKKKHKYAKKDDVIDWINDIWKEIKYLDEMRRANAEMDNYLQDRVTVLEPTNKDLIEEVHKLDSPSHLMRLLANALEWAEKDIVFLKKRTNYKSIEEGSSNG